MDIKVVPGFSRYAVDCEGNIYSLFDNRGRDRVMPMRMSPWVDRYGYKCIIAISDTGRRVHLKLHKIVALAHFGLDGLVRHLDDNKMNNSIENLAHGTQRDNIYDMYRNGKYEKTKPLWMKFDELTYQWMIECSRLEVTYKKMQSIFGISKGSAYNLRKAAVIND